VDDEIQTREVLKEIVSNPKIRIFKLSNDPAFYGVPLTKKEGAIKDSVIKLNYIFTISEKMVKKSLFNLSKEKKKILFDEITKRLRIN